MNDLSDRPFFKSKIFIKSKSHKILLKQTKLKREINTSSIRQERSSLLTYTYSHYCITLKTFEKKHSSVSGKIVLALIVTSD